METKGKKPENSLKLTSKEQQLIKLIRTIGFGEIKVFIADSQPVRAEEIRQSIKFQ